MKKNKLKTIQLLITNNIKTSPTWLKVIQGFFTGFIFTGFFILFVHSVYTGKPVDFSFLVSQLGGILLINSDKVLLAVAKILDNYTISE